MIKRIFSIIVTAGLMAGVVLLYVKGGYTLTLWGIEMPMYVPLMLLSLGIAFQGKELLQAIQEKNAQQNAAPEQDSPYPDDKQTL